MDEPEYYKKSLELVDALVKEKEVRGGTREAYDRYLAVAITDAERLKAYIHYFLVTK
jgi:hypothetical protein